MNYIAKEITLESVKAPAILRRFRLIWCMQVAVRVILVSSIPQPVYTAVFDCPSGDAGCLIEAITMANANDEGDTINLEEDTYTLTEVNNEDESPFDAGANGLPVIARRITINGADASNTIIARNDSAPPFRIFQIAATGVLTLDGVTTTGGKS